MRINLWIIVTLSLLGCCYGYSICGSESCNDLSNVKSCHNVQECIRDVWLKQTPTGLTDNVCDICLKMVKEARDQLQSNETMDELKQVLEGSCKLLMLEPAVKLCKKLADEFVPELVAMLSSQMDPEMVCTVAKLCNNKELRSEQENSKECFRCQNFISTATHFMEKVPKAEFKEDVLHVCRSLGSYSDACFLYAPLLGDFYFNQTMYALKKQPCEVLGVCPKYSKSLFRSSDTLSWSEAKTELCSLCPLVAGDIQKQLLRFGSVNDFESRLVAVCETLAMSKGRCSDIADYPRLFSFLSRNFDPVRFCSESFGLCSRQAEAVPVWPLLPVGANFGGAFGSVSVSDSALKVTALKDTGVGAERVQIAFGDPIEAPLIHFQNVDNCQSCINMFDFIINLATTDKSYLPKVLSVVCTNVPDPDHCKSFVALSNPAIVGALSQHFNSNKICSELVPSCNALRELGSGERSPGGACTFCLKTFQSLGQGLSRKEARSRLTEYLLQMCNSLPLESQITCQGFVNIFADRTVPEVLSNFNENETCGFLRVCSAENNALVVASKELPAKKGACKVCLLLMEELYEQLKNKNNEEEIRKALETICNEFPSGIKNTCNMIVENYADEIVQLVMAELKPSEVCKKIHFCPNRAVATSAPSPLTTASLTEDVQPHPAGNFADKVPCNFCLIALRMLLQRLEDRKTEDAIEKTLTEVCKYFPEETRDTCRFLINEYSDDLIDMIVADFNATEICVYLKMCGPKKLQEEKAFSVVTNEIRDNYGPGGACEFCTSLQNSMTVQGNEKSAESLLAFLVDVCVIEHPQVYPECKEIVSQKILPFGKYGILRMNNVCAESKVCPAETRSPDKSLFTRMQEAVQECAICETLVQIIASHEKMMAENFDFSGTSSLICTTVPQDKKAQCENLLISYGPSVVNLLSSGTELQNVCSLLSLCDKNQQAKLNMPVEQVEEKSEMCTRGPGFWCANVENAKKCGTLPHCQEVVWKQKTPPQ